LESCRAAFLQHAPSKGKACLAQMGVTRAHPSHGPSTAARKAVRRSVVGGCISGSPAQVSEGRQSTRPCNTSAAAANLLHLPSEAMRELIDRGLAAIMTAIGCKSRSCVRNGGNYVHENRHRPRGRRSSPHSYLPTTTIRSTVYSLHKRKLNRHGSSVATADSSPILSTSSGRSG
jgi:hypothetical protein